MCLQYRRNLTPKYSTQVLDKNHTGLISIQQLAKDPLLSHLLVSDSVMRTSNIKDITNALKAFVTSGRIEIDKQLKPTLIKTYQNITTAFNSQKCNSIQICPILWRSLKDMISNLSIIGNVSKSTCILILAEENDTQTLVEQAFLLQQRLADVNHTDHSFITYPNLGHAFYPSSQWATGIGQYNSMFWQIFMRGSQLIQDLQIML